MKNNIKRIISFALMLSLLVGMMMTGVSVSAAEETPEVEIVSKNVYYAETLKLMYAVRTDDANVKLNIYDADLKLVETITTPTETENKPAGTTAFTSTIGVPAQDIDTVFYAEAELSDGTKSKMVRYSVLEYLYERLTVSTNVSPEQKTMYNNLLAYADSADIVLNEDTENNIAKYAYVRVENGTVDGTYSAAMVLAGTALDSLATTYTPDSGKVLAWNIAICDLENDSSEITKKDTDLKAGAFTVEAGKSYMLTPTSESSGPVTKTATLAYTGSTTGNMTGNNDANQLGLDSTIFSVIGNKGGTNNNCGLNKSGQIRLYGSSSSGNGSYFTVSVADGCTIKSIKVNFTSSSNNKNCQLTVDGNSVVFDGSATTWEVDINSDSFTLKNVVTGSTAQIYISSIEITYTQN